MLRITKRSEYGLIALSYLAGKNGRYCPIREITSVLSIPRRILGEVFKDLVKAGVIRVARGPGGGYRLSEPPDQISLFRLVEALEGPAANGHARNPSHNGRDSQLGTGADELAMELREVLDRYTLARFAAPPRLAQGTRGLALVEPEAQLRGGIYFTQE
ncbi:MAG: Rrf2 family transcriptional regulator [Myxococcales bacterium]|nr:Rrf2 family transcriptional regulator [Myxococcales bacterium]